MAITCEKCSWCGEHVGSIGVLGNIGLFGVKLAGGIYGTSQALIADAVHSLSDIVVSVLVLVTLKVASAPPDEDHRWGHGHVEFIVSVIIGALLICAALTITVVSLTSIFEGDVYQPGIIAVWAAAISVIANEVMFRHSLCAGKQMDSPAMIANAWEKRADVYSSSAALIGAFGSRMGIAFFDPAAAIIVGIIIARSGIRTLIIGISGVTDRSSDRTLLAGVKAAVLEGEGVKDISRLRARRTGQKRWVDIEPKFEPETRISEVKRVVGILRKKVMEKFGNVEGVVIAPSALEPELKESDHGT